MAAEHHSRRSFLKGKAALREMSAAADEFQESSAAEDVTSADRVKLRRDPGAEPEDDNTLLVSVRRRAMACEWQVQLAATRDDDSMEHVFAALDLVEALEDQMTIYRADSEVIGINRQAADGPVEVEPRLFAIFQLADRLYRETLGAYDITSGPLSEAWGFSRRQGRLPTDAEIDAARALVGMRHVTLNHADMTIAFDRPGVKVNLNSIGKGYALDRMADVLTTGAVDDYLLHGGRSSVLARGDHPGRPGGAWRIGLRHPLRTAQRIAEFCLRDQSLSTSGSGTQFFERRGRRYGHILDPRTGRPAEGIFSATVIAPTAAQADALSTAFYVMGPEKTGDFCATRPEIAAVLVCPATREGDVQIHDFNLDGDRWQQFTDH